jgi:hypothetical protein
MQAGPWKSVLFLQKVNNFREKMFAKGEKEGDFNPHSMYSYIQFFIFFSILINYIVVSIGDDTVRVTNILALLLLEWQ